MMFGENLQACQTMHHEVMHENYSQLEDLATLCPAVVLIAVLCIIYLPAMLFSTAAAALCNRHLR